MCYIVAMKIIYECPVYCGRLKEWRVLNVNAGTVYTRGFETFKEASNSIDTIHKRNGWTVKRVTATQIGKTMDDIEFLKRYNTP